MIAHQRNEMFLLSRQCMHYKGLSSVTQFLISVSKYWFLPKVLVAKRKDFNFTLFSLLLLCSYLKSIFFTLKNFFTGCLLQHVAFNFSSLKFQIDGPISFLTVEIPVFATQLFMTKYVLVVHANTPNVFCCHFKFVSTFLWTFRHFTADR